jgi:hypothetical protein
MSNFDLRKYLAEGRLLKENSPVKSPDAFASIFPREFLPYDINDVGSSQDAYGDRSWYEVSVKIPKGDKIINGLTTQKEVSDFFAGKTNTTFADMYQGGSTTEFDVREDGNHFIVTGRIY